MFDYFYDLFIQLLDGLKDVLWAFFTEFGNWLFETIIGMIQTTMDTCGQTINITWAVDYWNNVNYFVPISELTSMLSIVFSVWITCFSLKVILKALPFVY